MEEALQGGTKVPCSAVGVAQWADTLGQGPLGERTEPWTEAAIPLHAEHQLWRAPSLTCLRTLAWFTPSQFHAPRVHF